MTEKVGKAPSIKTVAKAVGRGTEAKAFHLSDDESHCVGIGNLRVVITRDGKGWFAQGLEIDYAAGGPTLAKVKKNFERGLKGTINLHLQMYETIDKLLKPAPTSVWKRTYWAGGHKHYAFSQISFHSDIPQLDRIVFYEPTPEVAV
jgi:hypothetical protein